MSNKIVRTFSQPSNRANPKDASDKKIVFKGVLDSPFRIHWPSVPLNLQNTILTYITEKLNGAASYHFNSCSLGRKRKRAAKVLEESSRKRRSKIDAEGSEGLENERNHQNASDTTLTDGAPKTQDSQAPAHIDEPDNSKLQEPSLLIRHLIYGINKVTKRLETQTQVARHLAVLDTPQPPVSLKYVFVCRSDVDPPLLIDHLPHLVAAYNSNCLHDPIKLVTLPQGAELLLAQKLGIRRVAVVAIDNDYNDEQLTSMLEQLPTLAASWLSQPKSTSPLIPTHIKHVRTTAPKDMKAAKDLRNQQKAEAKKKKKLQNVAGSKG